MLWCVMVCLVCFVMCMYLLNSAQIVLHGVVLCCVVLCCVVRDLYWFRFGLTALTDLTIHILTLSFLFVLFFYFGLSDSLYR
mgnify:CR=1 FL=1